MNYIIPIIKRELRISNFGSKVAYVDVFGKGVRVIYSDEKEDLSPANLSRYAFGISDQSKAYIEADSPSEALKKFYEEYKNAVNCGLESQAIQISHRDPIEELPSCPSMKFNKNGHTVCIWGDEENFKDSEEDPDLPAYGCGCVLDFADYGPRRCPIENSWKLLRYDHLIQEIGGFKFKRLNKNCLTPEQVAEKRVGVLKHESAVIFGAKVAKTYFKLRKQHAKLDSIFTELKLSWPDSK